MINGVEEGVLALIGMLGLGSRCSPHVAPGFFFFSCAFSPREINIYVCVSEIVCTRAFYLWRLVSV